MPTRSTRNALPRALSVLLVATLMTGVGACAGIDWDPMQRETVFEETQRKFSQYVRWGHIVEASQYVVTEQRAEFLSLAPAMSDVRFTDYQILQLNLADSYETAEVEVQYSGYRLSMPEERTFMVSQSWVVEEGGQWQVKLELAQLREALQVATP